MSTQTDGAFCLNAFSHQQTALLEARIDNRKIISGAGKEYNLVSLAIPFFLSSETEYTDHQINTLCERQ